MNFFMNMFVWPLWRRVLSANLSNMKKDDIVVILGFPRSGTSIVSTLVHAAGFSFGDPRLFKKADWRNPNGFYEYRAMNVIDESLMAQSGNDSPLAFSQGGRIRARTLWGRVRRFFTRIRMVRVLSSIKGSSHRWAFKQFPASFYFWAEYVPQAKIIAVYRDPIESAYSLSKSFGRYSFTQYIDLWTSAHEELLYLLTNRKSIVLSLTALGDSHERDQTLRALATFVGSDVATLEKALLGGERFEKTREAVERLRDTYPLPERTQAVLRSLSALAKSQRDVS
jgi:hypothetical protein